MSYKSLMVHLEFGRSNAAILKVASDLAQRFDASVIGIGARKPLMVAYGGVCTSGEIIAQDRADADKEAEEAEQEFRAVLKPAADLRWRWALTPEPLCEYFAREARCADLILTGMERPSLLADTRHSDIGDLVMRAGRPVLVIPPGVERIGKDRMLLAWKDTREARRAAFDALPLLKLAGGVTVVQVAPDDRLDEVRGPLSDVADWLGRHGVAAEPLAVASHGSDAAALARVSNELRADVIVAGAYGHSRLREWVLGGVTYDLLLGSPRVALLSR